MTYADRYNAIIHYFQRHPVDKTKIYCECHHIQPRSCGGSNDKENLVNLPAAWHYRVHCYLPFVMLEQNNEAGYRKMLYAWRRCLNSSEKKINLMQVNKLCIEYKILKESESIIQKFRSKFFWNTGICHSTFDGKRHSEKTKKNMSLSHQQGQHNGALNSQYGKHWWTNSNTGESRSIKEGDPVPEGWVRGRKCKISEIGRNNLSENGKRVNHATTTGYRWITNGDSRKLLKPNEQLSEGWHFCRQL